MKKVFSALLIALVSFQLFAKDITAPEDLPTYYVAMDNKSGTNLFSAIHNIAKEGYSSSISYKTVWTVYETTDLYPEGHPKAGQIWDMYGGCDFTYYSNQCGVGGDYNSECDCYNREHSIPKSWFGGSESENTPGSDVFHLVPTDGYVNNKRSNYAFGEVNSATYTYNGNKLGTPKSLTVTNTICGTSVTVSCSSTPVFEPIDEYKGDFARGYFGTMIKWANDYQAFTTGDGSSIFSGTYTAAGYYGLTAYGVALLMKWHREDPVSQKEIDRNNGIQATQGNRNPFIDYPYLAEYLWGEHAGETVDMDQLLGSFENEFIPGESDGSRASVNPTLRVSSSTIVFDPIIVNSNATLTFTLTGSNLTSAINLATSGTGFTCNTSNIAAGNANGQHTISVTFTPTAAGNYNGSITISSTGADNVVVSLSGTCAEQRTITWNVNGSTYTTGNPTTTVANNGKPTVLPTVPASCDATSTTFVGWSKTNITSKTNTRPTDLFATIEGAPSISANTTFYAVFAKVSSGGSSNIDFEPNDFSGQGTSGTGSSMSATKDGVTLSFSLGYGTTQIRTYVGGEFTFASESNITSIDITTNSSKGNAENISLSNAVGTYTASGTSGSWTGESTSVTFSNADKQVQIMSISITCGGGISHSEYISVCGEQPVCTLSDISLNTTNVTTTFTQGDEFNSDGLVVTANYSDCESRVVTPTNITGYNTSIVGQQSVTVSYTENDITRSAIYNITITKPAPIPTYTITWNVDGTTTPITYDEGDELELPSTPDNCSNGKQFVGWTEQANYADESLAPSDLFTVASGTVTANKTYYAVYATVEGSGNRSITYEKVAAISEGNYLIVNEGKSKVFNGLSGTEKVGSVSISNNAIISDTLSGYEVIISSIEGGYSLQMVSNATNNAGKYLSGTSGSNTLNFGNEAMVNTISIEGGDATITSNTSILRYNNNESSGNLFRYYKSANTTFPLVQLYKKNQGTTTNTSDYTTACSNAPTSYSISLNQNASGTISATSATATAGETVTLTATPNTHYEFDSWSVLDATGATVNVTNNQFVMPASDVTVSATFNVIQYNISTTLTNVTADSNNPTSVSSLEREISLIFSANTGYDLPNDITVKIGETTLTSMDYIWDTRNAPAAILIMNSITGDVDITITATLKQYDIRFVDDDQTTELASIKVNHGATPVYPYSNPTKESTAQYTYSFSNWTPAIVAATDDEIYTAVYTPTLREYDIEISLNTSDENGTVAITRGEKEKYNYNDNIEITATPKAGYTFVRWSDNSTTNPRVISVDGSAIDLTAYFEPSTNVGYKVNYYQENIADDNYTLVGSTNKYGTTGAIAKIDTLLYEGFELASVEDKTIDGDGSTVVNVYYNRLRCSVTTYYFDYIDKQNRRYRIYTAVQYKYGQNVYTIPPIGDMSDSCYIYRPIGWSPELPTIVTNSSEHYALYDSIPQKYTLSWNANEGVLTGEYTNGTTAYATAIVAPTATREGYVFEGWLPNTPTTMPAKDITYVAQWTAAGTTPYVVNHYQQNLENDDYTLIEAENKQGAADASITPLTKEYTGFDAPSTQTTTIASNGSTVVNYYYNRHVYRIEFRHNPALQSHALLQADSLRYGAAVAFTGEAPTYSSGCQYEYTFTGWSPEITSVVGDQVYDAQFEKELKERRVTFRYNSTFYQIDTLFYGDMPSYRGETPTKNATDQYTYTFAGWEPEISVINCSRNVYDYNAKFDQALRKYTVTFYNADSTTVFNTQQVEYGKAATTPEGAPTKLGYEFSGWNATYNEITGNLDVYPIMIKSGNIQYVVNHYQQNIADDEFVLVESDTLKGEMDATITPAVKTYTGFDSPTPQTTTIAGDGSTVVEYQYTRKYYIVDFNYFSGRQHSSYKYGSMPQFDEQEVPIPNATDKYSFSFSHWEPAIHAVTEEQQYQAVYDTLLRSYVVRFYDSDSTTVLSSETYDWGTSNIPSPTTMTVPVGYRFSYWSSNIDAFWTSTSRVTGETNIYPQFVLQQYVIRVYNSEIGSVEYVGQKDVYHYGDIVTITANAVEGYHFAQWSDGNTQNPRTIIVGSSEFDSNNALNLTMQFAANTDTKYVVKHSLQNTNGEGYFLFQCDTLYGESGSFVRPDGLDTIGFITPSLDVVRIAADGSTVIELYYDRMTYKYQYRDYNSEQIGNIVEVLYGNEPEAPEAPAREGYTFTGWKVYEVIGVLTILDATYKQNETTALSDNTQDELLYYVANSCLYIENVPANSVVRIYDMSGRSLLTQQNCTGDITLQLPRINGIYVMSITTDNQTKTYKIVK